MNDGAGNSVCVTQEAQRWTQRVKKGGQTALTFQTSETCTVVVISGRLSDRESHAQVHVIVTDENDNAPELVYHEEPRVCENAAPGKVRQEGEFFP